MMTFGSAEGCSFEGGQVCWRHVSKFSKKRFSARGLSAAINFVMMTREHFDTCETRRSKMLALLDHYPLFEWTMLVRK